MFCLNPACPNPENPKSSQSCRGCGQPLNPSHRKLFHQRYRVVAVLGQGAFGRTYKVEDSNFNNKLRVLKKFIGQAQGAVLKKSQELFDREAEKLDDLKHEQIPTVYDHFREGNSLYLVQEFVEGENLLSELKKQGHFNETKIREILLELLPVLKYIHNKNLLHRDIKPDNIMRRRSDGKLMLIDFGGVKEISGTGGTIIYTPGYAAKEQMLGQARPKSDVYSLGATCVRLLTGCLPPSDDSKPDELYDVDEDRWLWKEKLEQQGKNISKQLEAVLEKMVSPIAKERYESVEEALKDLLSSEPPKILNQRPLVQPPLPSPPSPSIVISRKKFLQLLGWGGLGTMATVIGASLLPELFARTKSKPTPSPTNTPPNLQTTSFTTIRVNGKGKTLAESKHTAQYFLEDLGDGNNNLEMMAIPGGKFWMGSPEGEKGAQEDEKPRQEVIVPPFYLGKYPITQKQWQVVALLEKIDWELNPDPSGFKGENRPVEQVNWHEAVEFCKRLSNLTGREYRLPSEAEWEYACRAKTETPFHFGETLTGNLANYDTRYTYAGEAPGIFRQETTDVGIFPPNAFGLHDMHGNVSEWCQDDWHENYQGAPTNGSAWLNNQNNPQQLKSLRGGSWSDAPADCRSARRLWYVASQNKNDIGFRVACSPSGLFP